MRTIAFTSLLVLAVGALFAFRNKVAALDKISALMISRQVQGGKSITVKANIYYQRNGNMVTHFTYPRQYFVIANKSGEVKMYDPVRNSVILYQNFLFGTQSSQFYYFFSGKSSDMGLSDIGYVQTSIKPEKNLLVSLWKLKVPDKKSAIQVVKLVYQGANPVYMHYEDAAGKIIRKVFYANYSQLGNTAFPSTSTEIVYADGDSTVSKTNFSEFKFNQEAAGQYFDFQVPANAKIEK
ncbi:MAG: hypothetical protein ABI151_10340 [Chitinophagaceae bacterium]